MRKRTGLLRAVVLSVATMALLPMSAAIAKSEAELGPGSYLDVPGGMKHTTLILASPPAKKTSEREKAL